MGLIWKELLKAEQELRDSLVQFTVIETILIIYLIQSLPKTSTPQLKIYKRNEEKLVLGFLWKFLKFQFIVTQWNFGSSFYF